ncbi:MAG: hypothetical protein V7638_3888 [Acidobacteriota bacterium]|jgi:hypothetical protein
MTQSAAATSAGPNQQQIAQTLETTLNKRLKDNPIRITDGDKNYIVKSFNAGRFEVAETNPAGTMVTTGGVEQLDCNEHYLGLVLERWNDPAQETLSV